MTGTIAPPANPIQTLNVKCMKDLRTIKSCNYPRHLRKLFLIVRMTVIISFFLTVQVFGSAYSQATKLSLEMENTSLEGVINEIRDQSDFRFLYNHEEIQHVQNVNVTREGVTVEEILDHILKDYDLDYRVVNQVVIITPAPGKTKQAVEETAPEMIQRITYTGTVVDEFGDPVPFAAVVIKGTTLGTAADAGGNFTLEVPEGDYEAIVASSVGFISHQILIGEGNYFEFVLRTDIAGMEEVVVTGYASISRERATGSFEKVSGEQMDKPSSSISERLVGVLAGVHATVQPDGEIDFEIRGQSSLWADAQPLIVVDGFPIEGDFSSINPNNVESITVLKDAAAASIWGAKSANGVIVITTKRARKGEAKIEFSAFTKVSPKLDLDYVDPRATSAETIEYEQRGFNSDLFGGALIWGYPSHSTFFASSNYSQAFLPMNEFRQGRITESEMNSELARLATLDNRSQITDEFLRNPVTQQYNLSIYGGNDKMSNKLTVLYENGKDYYKNNNNDEVMVDFRNRVEVAKWLDFDFSGMLQYNDRSTNGISLYGSTPWSRDGLTSLATYDMLRDEDGNLTDLSHLYYNKPVLDELIPTENFPHSDWSFNPVADLNERDFSTNDLNARVQAGLTFKILKGLTYDSKILYERYSRNTKDVYGENSFAMRQMVNETSTWDMFTGDVTQNIPTGGGLKQSSTSIRNYNFRNQLNFVRTFSDMHAINFVAGSEMSSRVIETNSEPDVIGYDDDKLTVGRMLSPYDNSTSMWLGYPITYARYFYPISLDPTHSFTYLTDRYFSLYANLAYTVNDKYTLTGSARTDASNLITDDPQYRYAPFWSAGLGWQLGKEEFLQGLAWLDRLNLRGTYGINGNVDRSTSFLPLLNIGGVANIYTNETTASIGSFGNPTLRWERTKTIDIGIDYSLFSSTVFGSVDVYHRKGEDLIVSESIPSVNGTQTQKFNNGEMVNKGIELKIGTSVPIRGNDIVWIGNLNYAYNHNRITKFFKANYAQYDLLGDWDPTTAYVEGMDANTMWAFEYAGMNNFGTEAFPVMAPAIQGVDDAVYPITTWAPVAEARDFMTTQGTRVAPHIFGFVNTFRIYDFDLSIILTGKLGHVYRRHAFNYSPMISGNTIVNDKYSEVANGDPNEFVPIPENEMRYYFYDRYVGYMSYLTENASHIRFQEISLSYDVPRNVLSKLGFEWVRVYVQGNNLGTIVFNNEGEDPEYPIGSMKPMAAYTFGVKIGI